MTTDQGKTFSEDPLLGLMQPLEAGRSQTLRTYLQVMLRSHRDNWGTCLLICGHEAKQTEFLAFIQQIAADIFQVISPSPLEVP